MEGLMPASLEELDASECQFTEFEGWTEDISKVTRFADLPANAQKYVQFIED